MFCPGCGKQVGDGGRFCKHCGTSLGRTPGAEAGAAAPSAPPGAPEQVLFTFGPFGMDVCDGRYSIFGKWHRRNSVIVELTNTRLCALPNPKFGLLTVPPRKIPWAVRLPFEIPYASIVSVEVYAHPAHLGLMDVLDIRYREGEAVLEKSICSYKNNILRAYEVVIAHVGRR